LLNTRKLASSLQLNRVYLQDSAHAGLGQLGVFARIELEPGDLVTCYAADAVICVGENKQHCVMFSPEWRQTIPPHEHEQAMREGIDTMVRVSADFAIHSHRRIDNDVSCVGQFVNDAYNGITQNPFLTEMEYEQKSNAGSNCRYTALDNGLMIVIEATKHILAHEELLISYGFEHWRGYFQRQLSTFQIGQSNLAMTTRVSSLHKNKQKHIVSEEGMERQKEVAVPLFYDWDRTHTVLVIAPRKSMKTTFAIELLHSWKQAHQSEERKYRMIFGAHEQEKVVYRNEGVTELAFLAQDRISKVCETFLRGPGPSMICVIESGVEPSFLLKCEAFRNCWANARHLNLVIVVLVWEVERELSNKADYKNMCSLISQLHEEADIVATQHFAFGPRSFDNALETTYPLSLLKPKELWMLVRGKEVFKYPIVVSSQIAPMEP